MAVADCSERRRDVRVSGSTCVCTTGFLSKLFILSREKERERLEGKRWWQVQKFKAENMDCYVELQSIMMINTFLAMGRYLVI